MLRITRRLTLFGGLAAVLAGCASKFQTYTGPEVTRLELYKGLRLLRVYNQEAVLRDYVVDLGFAPVGPKQFEGDGKTPEGSYTIDRRNPDSLFHLSLGISYPNAEDIAFAEAQGKKPGGDIFIHGGPRLFVDKRGPDWTAGCISVSDREIREIYAMVPNGTPIEIFA